MQSTQSQGIPLFIDIFLKLFEITSESIFFLQQGIIQKTNVSQVKVKINIKKVLEVLHYV